MRTKKKLMVITGVILLLVLFFTILLNNNDDDQQGDVTPSTMEDQPTEDDIMEEVIDQVQEEDTESDDSIGEEIRKKVKQVVNNTIGFFVKNNLNIVAIGDSLTQGVGDTTSNGGYVGILSATLNDNNQSVVIENYGKRGNRSDQLLKRLDQTEIVDSIEEANIVLVTVGANDIMKVVKDNFTNLNQEPFETERLAYTERLHDIFDKILTINPDTEVYLIGFYNPFEGYFDIEELGMILDNWNTVGQNIATEYDQIHFIPTTDLFQGSEVNLLADDNFHPNVNGYKLIAERVLEYIRPSIESTE